METSKDVKSLLKEFIDWVKDEKITEEVDHDLLLRFLEGCKHRLDTAKAKYKNYIQLRKDTPEWFENRDPNIEGLQILLNLGVCFVFPDKDEKNRITLVGRLAIHDPKTMPTDHLYKLILMIEDYLLITDPDVSKNGINLLLDAQGTSIGHVFQMTPFLLKKTIWMWQNCYPIRFSSINLINCPPMVGFLINLMKTFMTQKLKKRVKVHGNNEDLHQILNPDRLPKEYGGTSSEIEAIKKCWAEKITKNREWFLNDMKKPYLIKD